MILERSDHSAGTPSIAPVESPENLVSPGFGLDASIFGTTRRRPNIRNQTEMSRNLTLPSTAFELKNQFSQIAMHLDARWRKGIFTQLDQVLDPDDWEPGVDELPSTQAWRTALRLLVYFKFKQRPGLALNQERPIFSWSKGDIRISIECSPNDRIRWIASRSIDGEREALAGDTNVMRFNEFVAPFNDDEWLVNVA